MNLTRKVKMEEIKDTNEAPKQIKLETCEDWVEFLKVLANKNCNKCYGKGNIGINLTTKMPTLCNAKRCSGSQLRHLQREERIKQIKIKQEESRVKNDSK